MTVLLSGYDRLTQELMFRVYAAEIPTADRKLRTHLAHNYTNDLLGAALEADFGVKHAKIVRKGQEKPLLVHESLHMNLSHCKGLAVAAIGKMPLGVDAEPPREIAEKMMRTVCMPAEFRWLGEQPAEQRAFCFSRLWTLKEAYTKYTGEGIRRPFSTLGFKLGTAADSLRNDTIEFLHPAACKVRFYQMLCGEKYAVSLCIPRLGAGGFDLSKLPEGWVLYRDGD